MNTTLNTQESFIHIVLFWLKNPTKSIDRKVFEQNMNHFLETSQYAKKNTLGCQLKQVGQW